MYIIKSENSRKVYAHVWVKLRSVNHPWHSFLTKHLQRLARPQWAKWKLGAGKTTSAKAQKSWEFTGKYAGVGLSNFVFIQHKQ